MSKSLSVSLVVLSLVALGGCGGDRKVWESPASSQAPWEAHREECRALAARQAEREFALDERGVGEIYGRPTVMGTSVARFDADRRRELLFDRCMKDRVRPAEGAATEVKEPAPPPPRSSR